MYSGQLAHRLGRGRGMRILEKLEVRNIAELVRLRFR
jgi:hypothetical protein